MIFLTIGAVLRSHCAILPVLDLCVQGARPSVIDWPLGKFPWSKERKNSKGEAKAETKKAAESGGEEGSGRLSPKSRPRSKSDRFSRPSRKQVADVYKQAAFDWPLGPLGRIKQAYSKSRVPKAKSEDQLAEVGTEGGARLKRRSSERQKRNKGVQFEDQQATPWWNYPLKMMRGAAASGGGSTATAQKRRRRRHYTDPESRKEGQGGWREGHTIIAGRLLYCTVLYFTGLDCTALHCTALN